MAWSIDQSINPAVYFELNTYSTQLMVTIITLSQCEHRSESVRSTHRDSAMFYISIYFNQVNDKTLESIPRLVNSLFEIRFELAGASAKAELKPDSASIWKQDDYGIRIRLVLNEEKSPTSLDVCSQISMRCFHRKLAPSLTSGFGKSRAISSLACWVLQDCLIFPCT